MEVILHLEVAGVSCPEYGLLLRDAPLNCQLRTSMPEGPPTGSSCLSIVGRWRYRTSDCRC